MRTIRFIASFFAVIFVPGAVFSQTITGRVVNKGKDALEGATVSVLSKDVHAHTNENGYFLLQHAKPGDSIRVTHIGYKPMMAVIRKDSLLFHLSPSPFQLNEVAISFSPRHLNIISAIDLNTNPVNSSQELLRLVPGLFIGQHAGGGKAEQIFLRGFDIDHGTDISISVDGMPVNMVSHAHGQGYADLHFLIPETVEKVDFDKGPYFANKGNMATAGYVAFKTKERLDESSVTLQAGSFNTFKTLALFNVVNNEKQSAYLAADFLGTDGPFLSPQNFSRINMQGKYTAFLPNQNKLSLSLSHFTSKWDASGQIPVRAVESGQISRFGAIDDTEGGNTSRTNFNLQFHQQIDPHTYIKNTAFYSLYDFELFSNFTFFLEYPVNGDQIRQKENRQIFGFESQLNKTMFSSSNSIAFQAGTGIRNDAVYNNELSHTLNRETTLVPLSLGEVHETNAFAYSSLEWRRNKWTIHPGIRLDYFRFQYTDQLAPTYTTASESKAIVSPKLNVLFTPHQHLQFFFKSGKGFHSNDTRVVVARQGNKILPAAYGSDIGLSWKPAPRVVLNSALWYLFLQQEFVYVGDAGIVEPSGKSTRKGWDVGMRYQLNNWLFLNGDFTYTHARSTEESKGNDYIPLAPKTTFSGGLSIQHPSGFTGGIKTRHLGNRPANEDNSIVAKGYLITDANAGFERKNIAFGIMVENLFDAAWNETQFATESRLQNEPQPVEEIHFTPGTPFGMRVFFRVKF